MIRLKVSAIVQDQEAEVEGKYYPGYESSIVKNFGDDEDRFVVQKVYINGKKIKLSEEDIEELSEELLEAARDSFSEIEDDFVGVDEDEEDDDMFSIVEEEE